MGVDKRNSIRRMPDMIYFIRQRNKLKIGYTEDVDRRIKELQTGSPVRLQLLKVIPGDQVLERQIHELFKEKRAQGEWFHYSGVLKACVKVLCEGHNPTSLVEWRRVGLQRIMRETANKKARKGDNTLKQKIRGLTV